MLAARLAIAASLLTPCSNAVLEVKEGQLLQSVGRGADLRSAALLLSEHANYEFSEVARYGESSRIPAWTATGTSLARNVYEVTQLIGTTRLTLIDERGTYWIRGSHGRFARLPAANLPMNIGSPEGFLVWLSRAHVDAIRGSTVKFDAVTSGATNLVDFAYKTKVTGTAIVSSGTIGRVSILEPIRNEKTFVFVLQVSHVGHASRFKSPSQHSSTSLVELPRV